MTPLTKMLLVLAAIVAAVFLASASFTVRMGEQVIITQFGKPVGEPVIEPGLHFKAPFIQEVNRFEKRILEWDGRANEMATRDKVYIEVDTFARWRIVDLEKFFVRLRDERSALSRLDDILGSETMSAVARHDLIEIIRTDKDRKPLQDAVVMLAAEHNVTGSTPGALPVIREGRLAVEKQILEGARPKLEVFGIELLDVRFKRLDYDQNVLAKIYERMISERRQIAERFRSEGAAMAARIDGDREKELRRIESEAYRKVQEIRGQADAKATETYAKAFNQSNEAADFYTFLKSMETYQKGIPDGSMVILSTDSDLWRYLRSATPPTANPPPPAPATPAPASASAPAPASTPASAAPSAPAEPEKAP